MKTQLRLNQHILTLKDGRRVGYAQYGDLKGKPLFFLHGWPSSRLHGERAHDAAKKLHIRIISPDRPGFGYSGPKPDRILLDYPDDIVEIADQLRIKIFSVAGVSGGGPYAAVCAYKIPKRIKKVGIVVGLAPTYIPGICEGMAWSNKVSWTNYGRFPFLCTLAASSIWLQAKIVKKDLTTFSLADADKELHDDLFNYYMQKDREQSVRQGIFPAALDLRLYTSNWGFELDKIKVPVYLWYGRDDKNVSLKMGKYYKSQIPNSKLTIYPGGHFSWIEHAEEILDTLTT